jgi:hypothetical protein
MSDDLDLRPIKSRLAALDDARRAVAVARAIPWELVGERAYALEQSLLAESRAAGALLGVAERDLAALVAEVERLRRERGDSETAGPAFVDVPVGSVAVQHACRACMTPLPSATAECRCGGRPWERGEGDR